MVVVCTLLPRRERGLKLKGELLFNACGEFCFITEIAVVEVVTDFVGIGECSTASMLPLGSGMAASCSTVVSTGHVWASS